MIEFTKGGYQLKFMARREMENDNSEGGMENNNRITLYVLKRLKK
ncbi:hypothetical protein JOC69_003497 [Heliobacterium gestii]|nr:hypothetical protein [Heliomicrobium gestii]